MSERFSARDVSNKFVDEDKGDPQPQEQSIESIIGRDARRSMRPRVAAAAAVAASRIAAVAGTATVAVGAAAVHTHFAAAAALAAAVGVECASASARAAPRWAAVWSVGP